MIFGSGFAPFRGGPLHYAQARGPAEISARVASLAEIHGERFAPNPRWDAHVGQQGLSFDASST